MMNKYEEALNDLYGYLEDEMVEAPFLFRSCLDDLKELLNKYEKLEKALDKSCKMLTEMKGACDCYEFDTCPFREKCSEGTNYCYNKNKWKELALKDE